HAVGEFFGAGARPPTQEVVPFIDANRDEFGVEPICTVLRSAGMQVAPSAYYANQARPHSARAPGATRSSVPHPPAPAPCRDAVIGPALRRLWEDNYRVYGARKLWKAARRAGHHVGRDQVARHMRPAGSPGARR